jgi:uncharacterized protein YdiU (UPF0061 family)
MYALGIPTTRALAAVTTGDRVTRDQFEPGAVLARVAQSHIRIGTFQFFAARQDTEALRILAGHVLARHYPDAPAQDNPALALLENTIGQQAALMARWQLVGFIHGVMNTDNMLLSGETIDYGPCAFMDEFHPDTVYSSIDHGGRYAYRNQPGIAQWNLVCLAQALLPLLHDDQEEAVALAQQQVDSFPELFRKAHQQGMGNKLGLTDVTEEDSDLIEDLFQLMAQEKADFTLAFRRLADLANEGCPVGDGVAELFEFPDAFQLWLARWRERTAAESTGASQRQAVMYRANPAFIPRNHLVEEAIRAAVDENNFEPFHKLVEILAQPHTYDSALARYAIPPQPQQVVRQTFCGT